MKEDTPKYIKELRNTLKNKEIRGKLDEDISRVRNFLELRKKIKAPKKSKTHWDYVEKYIKSKLSNQEANDEYYQLQTSIEEKYGLHIYGEAFNMLILYNDVIYLKDIGWSGFTGTYDLNQLLNFSENGVPHSKESIYNLFQMIAQRNPVVIFLNPYMNSKDIHNLIDKEYRKEIEPRLKHYRKESIGIGGHREKRKDIQEIEDFIKERLGTNMSGKQLARLVNDRFGTTYTYNYINELKRKLRK